MRLYFITIHHSDGRDDSYEYHSSIAKAKKSRAMWKRIFKIDESAGTVSKIFKTDITPTKKGIIRFLNYIGGGTPIK